MARKLVSDELWNLVSEYVPNRPPSRKGGRPPVENRRAFAGIVFVLKTGIPWQDLPQEMECGSGMTCWRRLQEWEASGTWEKIHQRLLSELRRIDRIDLSRAIVDSSSIRAVFGGTTPGPAPRIAGKTARSTISSPMRKVFRWRPPSQRPTVTT